MRTLAVVASLAFARALLATTLHVGPPLPIADLRPGDPATWDRVMATWTDASGVNAAVARITPEHFQVVRMTIRDDGTADPAALDSYPIPVRQSGIAPIGDDLMAVWNTFENDTVEALRIGRDGTPRSAGIRVPFGQLVQRVLCSDASCFVDAGPGGIFIDANGNLIARPVERVDDIVASPVGFLTYDVVAKAVAVRDRQGIATKIIGVPDVLADLSWDGARYLVLSQKYYDSLLVINKIDPSSGVTSTQTIDLGTEFLQVQLTWNGTQYLLKFQTTSGYAVMRLDASLRPIDAAPKTIDITYRYAYPVIVGTDDGFRILFQPIDYLRTIFVRNDGTIIPGAQPVITDRASQKALAAASNRSAILGVWSEGDDVFAARIRRDGRPLDVTPIAIGRATTPLLAASDGDGFLVVWNDSALLIDADGRTTRFDLPIDDPLQYATLEFTNGAYQLALFGISGKCKVVALTIMPTGAVTQVDSIPIDCGTFVNSSVAFDGRHIVALGPFANHLRSVAKDVVTGVVTNQDLLDFTGSFPPTTALARDGDSLLAFYMLSGTAWNAVYVNRLTLDGRFVLSSSVLTSTTYADSIIRIVDTWYLAAEARTLTPFSNVTFVGGAPVTISDDYVSRIFPGWDGEALFVSTRDVAVTSGWATQMIVRIVGSTVSRRRAAGK